MSGGKNPIHKITFILLVIGGLNWLCYGLLGFDVSKLWGGDMMGPVSKTIYILVGLSAVYEIAMHKSFCKMCDKGMAAPKM